MPVTIKTSTLKYKDPETGQYKGVDAVAETTTSQQVAAIESAGAGQISDINDAAAAKITAIGVAGDAELDAIDAKAAAAIASVPEVSEMEAMISGVFNSASNYKAGEYVIQEVNNINKLYKFTADYAANDGWSNAQVVEAKVGNEVFDLKSAFQTQIYYEDTSTDALSWRKGSRVNNLGRYSNSHPESVGLYAGPKAPYISAGTTFTVNSGYIISMAVWSVYPTSSTSISYRLYLAYNIEAGTVTSPIDGYMTLSIAKADGTAIAEDVDANTFAAAAVNTCAIYKRSVKTEIADIISRINDLYIVANDAEIWLSGAWAVATGAYSDRADFICTRKYIPTDYMTDALGIVAASGYEFSVFCWALDDTYMGSWTGSGFSKSSSTFFTRIMFAEIEIGHKYVINLRKTDKSNIAVNEYVNVSFIVPTCYKKIDTRQGLSNSGKMMVVSDDGKVAPMRQGIDYHTDLVNAQRGIAEDWHLPFIDMADEMMLGANHQIPGTATIWSVSGTTDLTQKNVWMSDGTHPYRGVGLVDMYGRTIANQMALITPSYHDGAGQSSPSYWAGKNLLWMGTSIPAGSDPEAGDGDGATYPSLVATQLGATVTNIAKGSSMLRIASSTGLWQGVAYSHFLRAVTRMTSEADALAANWANIYQAIPNAPSELPPENLQTMKNLSFENLLLPYLNGTNTAPDAIVIDYGHNDTAKGIDGGGDFWVRPTQESIASGLLADDTWMTANNYANLKLAFNDDLSGITDLPAFAASLNRNCFIGATNFLLTLILRYKPYMRIIFVSDYN